MVSETNPLIRAKRRAGRVKRWIRRKVYERNIGKQYKAWLAEAVDVHPGSVSHLTVVSILVPVYNPPVKFLRECLESVVSQRARNWRARWDQTAWPPATHTIFLWITDKGFARLEAIWSAWTHHALLPAFFTTVETLTLGTGSRWQPWNPRRRMPDGRTIWVWHDMYGRPRSLRPWDLEEATLRFEQPVPIRMRSLGKSMES